MKNLFKKNYLIALLGNLFEHYDKALFSFLSPFLASFLFPQKDPTIALIFTYFMLPLSMLARPLGSLVFGVIGDRYGRRQSLFLSLGGMGALSILLAFFPTYQQLGIFVPLFFCLARFLQNFFSAGETMGGGIYLLEVTTKEKEDLISGYYGSSTIAGILLASAAVSVLTSFHCLESGWRFLFLGGGITIFFAFPLIRTLEKKRPTDVKKESLKRIFFIYKKPLLILILASGFNYANYSMSLILMNGFIPLVSSVSSSQMIYLNTALLVLDMFFLPFFGYLSSRISREKWMLFACLCIIFLALPLFNLLVNASLITVVFIRILLVLFGVAFSAPFHSFANELVPKEHRYTLISFGYAIGSQLLGGSTAGISLWLYYKTKWPMAIGFYWVFLAMLCVSTLLWLKKSELIMRKI